MVLGQLPTGDNSQSDKGIAQLLLTGPLSIPRTSPHPGYYFSPGPLQTSKTTHQDQYMTGGEYSPGGDLFGYELWKQISFFLLVFVKASPVRAT